MKALVTGAGGFIASHLVEHLLGEGYDVRALAHYRGDGSIGHLDSDCEVVRGDIRDGDRLKRMTHDVDVIFNLAALISIPHSYASPSEYMSINAGGCLNALNASRRNGCRLVQMSASDVYGTARYVPMDETHPVQTQSPYAASKAAADALCRSFHASFDDCDVVIARPFNVCGPRQSVRAVIPQLILQQLRAPGSRPVLGTLTATRDFTYVTDTVRGLRMLAECRKARGLEVNIGSERDIPMGGLATLVQCVMYGAASDPVLDESWARPERSEVQRLLSDSSLMNALTGWSPEVPLREAIAATAVWMEMSLDEMPTGRVM